MCLISCKQFQPQIQNSMSTTKEPQPASVYPWVHLFEDDALPTDFPVDPQELRGKVKQAETDMVTLTQFVEDQKGVLERQAECLTAQNEKMLELKSTVKVQSNRERISRR